MSVELFGMWIVAGIAIVLPVFFLLIRQLQLNRDYYFWVLYAQCLIYLHIAPNLYVTHADIIVETRRFYFLIQTGCLLLFEYPFLLLYLRDIKRLREGQKKPCFLTWSGPWRQIIACLYVILFAICFVWVAAKDNILFLWYGNEMNARILASLPKMDWVIYRGFIQSGVILAALFLTMLLQPQKRWQKVATAAAFGIAGCGWFLWAVINSRASVIIGTAVIMGVFVYRSRIKVINPVSIALCAFIVIYGFIVASNVRRNWQEEQKLSLKMFAPIWLQTSPQDVDLHSDFRWRMNGIELMAEMTPAAMRHGFALGEAWKGIAYTSLVQYISPSSVEQTKVDFSSSSKVYLMQRYTNIEAVDWASCMLTEVYGNFFFLGFPVLALAMSKLCSFSTRMFSRPSSGFVLIMSQFILFQILPFEQEAGSLIFGWLRSIPGILPLCLINSFKLGDQSAIIAGFPKRRFQPRSIARVKSLSAN